MASNRVIIGARGSALSMWQAEWVRSRLQESAPHHAFEIQPIKTLGDKIKDAPLAKIGSTGLFVKEIEQALLDGRIDLAVHSLKDLPTEVQEGLVVAAAGPREDPRDVLVSKDRRALMELQPGARIGTSSLRRRAQVLHLRPDLEAADLRGNVDTRLRKALEGDYDSIVLAAAGLKRMGLADAVAEYLSPDICLPAVGQGIIGVEARSGDARAVSLAALVSHPASEAEMRAERAFMQELQGGCQVPIGALATVENEEIILRGMVASLDGRRMIRDSIRGHVAQAAELGLALAARLKANGAEEILAEIRGCLWLQPMA